MSKTRFSVSPTTSTRRRWTQLSSRFQGTLLTPINELPLRSPKSSSSSPKIVDNLKNYCLLQDTNPPPSDSTGKCVYSIYRAMLLKYIQCQSISRRTRRLVLLGCVSLTVLILVDQATTPTTSTSKWARMMYEDSSSMAGVRGAAGSGDANNNNKYLEWILEQQPPRDLHIAFVGDSVTRYMYLDLVYFLKHNRWVQDDDHPNILNAKQFPSWNDHYNASNLALAPNEECDCFRNNPKNSSHIDKEETIENRYYADAERNNYVTFVEIFGGYPPHGHWHPEDVNKKHQLDFEKLQNDPFVWRNDWPGLIRNYLNELDPRPDYMVFNEGLWIEHDLGNEEVRQSIKDALGDTGIIGIYKTTTLPNINSGLAKRSAGVVFNRHDNDMCELIGNYLDFSWTKDLGDEHYWDGVHFKPHVNRGMNMELLDFLNRFKERKESPATTVAPIVLEENKKPN